MQVEMHSVHILQDAQSYLAPSDPDELLPVLAMALPIEDELDALVVDVAIAFAAYLDVNFIDAYQPTNVLLPVAHPTWEVVEKTIVTKMVKDLVPLAHVVAKMLQVMDV